jgi:GntR family transcriptional regulator
VIRFRVDGRSGVPPYQQIVQQVRQALRMGVLTVGDQLPSVREVVTATAINPNTVLKAYRDLEREGLVEARTGHGTFVRARPPRPPPGPPPRQGPARWGAPRPPGPPPGTHSRLGRGLASWVREARGAGLDDDAIESLLRITLQAQAEEDIA